MMRNCASENLEIPRGAIAPLRPGANAPSRNDGGYLRLRLRNLLKAIAHPVDRDAGCGIALEMVLHQKPDVAALWQQRHAQAAVGEQGLAAIFGQHADSRVTADQGADNADVAGDAARVLL